jgi:hypothetical protein
LPGVLLVREGSRCLDSVLVFLDTARCRRALLREGGCGRSFLIACDSVPTNDQSKHATGVNSLLSSFGTERCRPTFRAFRCACRGAIANGEGGGFILPLELTRSDYW